MQAYCAQHLLVSLDDFDRLFFHEIVDVEFAVFCSRQEVGVSGVKGHINSKLAYLMASVLLYLNSGDLLNEAG